MSDSNIQILYQGTDVAPDSGVWINLEQGNLPVYDGNVSLQDLLNMTTIARQQETALSYKMNDGIYFSDEGNVINIPLTFYVFPSSMSLPYSIQIPQGELSDRSILELPRTGNIVVPLSTSVSFRALVTNAVLDWTTPCYDRLGRVVARPNYEINNNILELDNEVFGVLRGNFTFVGYEYTLTLSFTKVETTEETYTLAGLRDVINRQTNYNSITNIQTTVICTYLDENGEEQKESLDLQIPKSVEMYLSECPGGGVVINWPDERGECYTTYYYSICDGLIIHTERSEGCIGTI